MDAWEAWKEQQALQQKGEPSIISLLHAAGAAAMRQKFVQFAMVLHLLQQQRPVVAYEHGGYSCVTLTPLRAAAGAPLLRLPSLRYRCVTLTLRLPANT